MSESHIFDCILFTGLSLLDPGSWLLTPDDRAQKPQDMRTRALDSVSCIPAFRFSKWRRTNQNLTRHCGRCQAAVLALRIFQHR